MPILSVIVPTHNRSEYALSCLKSLIAFEDRDIEFVVSDTSADGRLESLLNTEHKDILGDPRLVYSVNRLPSNLTKNHNDALDLATGEYVCVIGDDDSITLGAIIAARWAQDNRVPLVSQTVSANYVWPDFRARLTGRKHAGRLYLPRNIKFATWRRANDDLRAALARGLQGTNDLPRCYHGIVRRDLLNLVKRQSGEYFHGSSPDMSGAVSMGCLLESYVETDLPLTIPGASGGSNSGRSAMNTHKGELDSESQTSVFAEQGWSVGVPRFFSVETVWSHAGLTTLEKLRSELLPSFNYPLLLALCRVNHPEFNQLINAAAEEASGIVGREIHREIEQHVTAEKWRRKKYLARRLLIPTAANGRKYISGVQNIDSASNHFEEYAQARKFYEGYFESISPKRPDKATEAGQ